MWNFFQETGRWFLGPAENSDKESSPPRSDPEAQGLSAIDEVLRQLFRQHGVDAQADGGPWILLPHGRKLRSRIHQREAHQGVSTVQLDLLLELSPQQTLIESFAGVGELPAAAVLDALDNFRVGSLHVFLAAFCDQASDQVDCEEWTIDGQRRRVVLGPLGIRGEPPVGGSELVAPVHVWEAFIKGSKLGSGIHWTRLFYAQQHGRSLACEVLLDNEIWPAAQEAASAADWPAGEEFYSVRLFVVVRDLEG